jgi:hypothetical protein
MKLFLFHCKENLHDGELTQLGDRQAGRLE